ncbi:chemotaxis protein CheW [Cognaticolwellia mytili]|uniref:chemotaxis protein CheW n=1 Tax=Cognaticolwellia mytili TaxID=1888913 RepID=UPI000A171D89|nr:chemotaxis protein CheW [Cognaticolwellia mytili]
MDIQTLANEIPVQGEYALEGIDFISTGEQYLTFSLGQEQYAVNILSVEEIRSWEQPTHIPNAPKFVKGVINMRGIIVPIIDLRLKFGIGDAKYSKTTVVVVLTAQHMTKSRTMGFVVDAVSDVLNAEQDDIKAAPAFGGNLAQHYIEGIVNVDENVVTLLNVNALQVIAKQKANS